MNRIHRLRVAAVLLALFMGSAVHAQATSFAELRFAHFSPDAPDVDVLIDDVEVLSDVPLFEVSEYLEIAAGTFNLKVREAGAATPVMIDEDLTLPTGAVGTIAISGWCGGQPCSSRLS